MKKIDSPISLLIFIFFATGIIYIVGVAGCNNPVTSSSITKYQARSEREFVANQDLYTTPGSVAIFNLEDVNSPAVDTVPDTGTLGEDIFKIRYTENAVRTYRMENNVYFWCRMVDVVTGEWTFEIAPENNNVTLYIPAGDYYIYMTSYLDYSIDSSSGSQKIFFQPEGDEFHSVFSVGGCRNCDLSGVDLRHMTFNGLTFSGSNFSKAILGQTSLVGTNFSNANLNETYFFHSNMNHSNLSNSYMKDVVLRSADLSYANLEGSDLTNADLRFADINFADFCNTNKTGLNTVGIIYNSQTQCWP